MSAAGDLGRDYLALRRELGFKMQSHGWWIPSFTTYLDSVEASTITTAHALTWACLPVHASPHYRLDRLAAVRGFARYAQAFDPATEIPPTGLLSGQWPRRTPYLYSEEEISRLLDATTLLRPAQRALTYRTVLALLAVTGMRLGEALGLDRDDVDLNEGLLTIRKAKYDKTRQIPLHATSVAALEAYCTQRFRARPLPPTAAVFLNIRHRRLSTGTVETAFQKLRAHAGLDSTAATGHRPRLHDLRHTFAVRTLLGWYQTGVDVDQRMPLLSTYLGHVDPDSTYWYLTGSPELFAIAAQRLDAAAGDQS